MSPIISSIRYDRYTDIHGRLEYPERFLALDGDTVLGVGDSPEEAADDAVRAAIEADVPVPSEIEIWDQAVRFLSPSGGQKLVEWVAKVAPSYSQTDAVLDEVQRVIDSTPHGETVVWEISGAHTASKLPEIYRIGPDDLVETMDV